MTIEEVKSTRNCSRIAAFGTLYQEVTRLNQQFPKVERGNEFNVQTLMKIVEKYEWSRFVEEEVMQEKLNYESLYTKLSASLVVWENDVARQGLDPDKADYRRSRTNNGSFFTGYGEQYVFPISNSTLPPSRTTINDYSSRLVASKGNVMKNGSNNRRIDQPFNFKTEIEIDSKCFRCGRPGHWRSEGTYSNSIIDAVKGRIRNMGGDRNKAAARILFELASEEKDNHFDTVDDEDIFEALVNAYQLNGDENKTDEIGNVNIHNVLTQGNEHEQGFQHADG